MVFLLLVYVSFRGGYFFPKIPQKLRTKASEIIFQKSHQVGSYPFHLGTQWIHGGRSERFVPMFWVQVVQ